jgi:putative exosortase-associated protein (TIGR04073 family)
MEGRYDYQWDQRMQTHGKYESEIAGKFSRGLTNTMFGWVELMRTPVRIGEDPQMGVFRAFFLGVPYGMLRAVGRTLVGTYEMVTSPAPQSPIFAPLEGEVL